MSRSVKNRKLKHGAYLHWVSFSSNKKDKRAANRKMRHNNKQRVRLGKDPYSKIKEICDIWNFNSDGSCYYISFLKDGYRYGQKLTKEEIRKINQK